MATPVTITTMAATGNTTRAEPIFGNTRQTTFLILVAALAMGLLVMSWPRLMAALHYLPVDRAIQRYYVAGEAPTESLEALEQTARESISLHSHQRYWDGLGLLYYLQGSDSSRPLYQQRESFELSVQATGQSLQLAPVQPRAWLRRAHAQGWLSFRDTGISEAFKMSVYTGRVEPALLIWRLQLGYSRLGQLDQEARGLLRDQTLLAWQLRQKELSVAMKNGVLDFRRVSSLLVGTDTGILQEMEAALAGRAR
jgi:hypothetical protein